MTWEWSFLGYSCPFFYKQKSTSLYTTNDMTLTNWTKWSKIQGEIGQVILKLAKHTAIPRYDTIFFVQKTIKKDCSCTRTTFYRSCFVSNEENRCSGIYLFIINFYHPTSQYLVTIPKYNWWGTFAININVSTWISCEFSSRS